MEKTLFLPQCQSTNDEAWAVLDAGRGGHGTLIYTQHQTAGRGQRGTSWQATPGQNLLSSTLLHTAGAVGLPLLFDLSRAIALACADAVKVWTEGLVDPTLKWPNDLYAEGRKLGGILVENRLNGPRLDWTVVGFGLNVNQTVFEPGLSAISLRQLTGQFYFIDEGAQHTQAALAACLTQLKDPATLRARYHARLGGINQTARYQEPNGPTFDAVLLGTTPEGLLRLMTEQGERRYEVKEVAQINLVT